VATLLVAMPHAGLAQSDNDAVRNDGGDMTDSIKLTREWLDMVAMGPAEAWNGKVDEDVVIRLPYAPPGVASELRGSGHARETLSEHWKTKRSFAWRDVVIRRTEDPELLVTTARSEVMLVSGQPYQNDYIMLTRIRGGKIVEHVEYFNPLPIVEMLKQ
jgi:ketosteroid isomerase-like protein